MYDDTPAPRQSRADRPRRWRLPPRANRRRELELLRDRLQLLEVQQAAYGAALSSAFRYAGHPVPGELEPRRPALYLVGATGRGA